MSKRRKEVEGMKACIGQEVVRNGGYRIDMADKQHEEVRTFIEQVQVCNMLATRMRNKVQHMLHTICNSND